MTVELTDGRTFHVAKIHDTYHVVIDGQAYCASSQELLLEGLARHVRLARHIYVPPRDSLREAVRTLISATSSLQDRQIATDDIRNLAAQGNTEAQEVVRLLDNRPRVSPHAHAITKKLGKDDFSQVTHEELVKHVNDLVLRSKLILELSDRVRLG